jgi:hypothetical protein
VKYSRIHDNGSLGINNLHGSVLESEFFGNSLEPASIGYNASAIKGIDEYEAGRLFVHDEQGNGLWCDVGCDNDPASGLDDDFWVHDSVVGSSRRSRRSRRRPCGRGSSAVSYYSSPTQDLPREG